MAEGAIHGVELHAVFKTLIRRHERVGDARRVTLNRRVNGSHREMALKMRRLDVGDGGKKAKHGEAEPAEDENQERDDDAKQEFSHEASGSIVADGWARTPADAVDPAYSSRPSDALIRGLHLRVAAGNDAPGVARTES